MTDNADPDHKLMRRVAQGDEAAFVALIRKYNSAVHSFVYRMLGDADDADDIAQETFIKVYRAADLYRPRAKFTTWLFAIANNLATDRLRKSQRRPSVSGEEADARLRSTADAGNDPRQSLEGEEKSEAVRQAIQQLPPDQKTALVLFEYEGLSYAEIAEVMQCSVKSVESRLYRAKEFLQKKLSRWMT